MRNWSLGQTGNISSMRSHHTTDVFEVSARTLATRSVAAGGWKVGVGSVNIDIWSESLGKSVSIKGRLTIIICQCLFVHHSFISSLFITLLFGVGPPWFAPLVWQLNAHGKSRACLQGVLKTRTGSKHFLTANVLNLLKSLSFFMCYRVL